MDNKKSGDLSISIRKDNDKMHSSMPAYITELSDNDFDILEEIFIDKYQKFIQLYWLLKEYSDNIARLQYNNSDKNELNISMKIVNIKPDVIISELSENIDDGDDITIYNNKKIIQICIKDSEDEEEDS